MENKTKVEEYLAKVDFPERQELKRIRRIVKETAPETKEGMSYGMPGFKYKGKYLIGYAAFKDHLSLFPTSLPIEELKDRLTGYKIAKGTIQFTLEKPLPESLIKEIIKQRISQIDQ